MKLSTLREAFAIAHENRDNPHCRKIASLIWQSLGNPNAPTESDDDLGERMVELERAASFTPFYDTFIEMRTANEVLRADRKAAIEEARQLKIQLQAYKAAERISP